MGNERRLIALYLLTVADIRGTSPKVWNAWKGKLLEDLFWSTRRFLGGDTDPAGSRLQSRQKLALQKLRLYALPDGVHEKLWAQLDTTYFLRHDAREIAWHTRLLNYRVDTPEPVVKARLSPVGEGVQVLIYTPDRKNLFAQICAFFERIELQHRRGEGLHHAARLRAGHLPGDGSEQGHDATTATSSPTSSTSCRSSSKRDGPLPPPVKGRVSRRVRSFPITPEVSVRPDESGRSLVSDLHRRRPSRPAVERGAGAGRVRHRRADGQDQHAGRACRGQLRDHAAMRCARRAISSGSRAI